MRIACDLPRHGESFCLQIISNDPTRAVTDRSNEENILPEVKCLSSSQSSLLSAASSIGPSSSGAFRLTKAEKSYVLNGKA